MFAPYDCAALLYREPRLAKAVHTQDASYLDVIHTDGDEWNPSDLAYHLTRRARGLPLWFSLAVNGTDAYSRAVESALDLTRWTARLIEASDHLILLREPTLSIVLFERHGWEPADYDRWARGPPRRPGGAGHLDQVGGRARLAAWCSCTRGRHASSLSRSWPRWSEGRSVRREGVGDLACIPGA